MSAFKKNALTFAVTFCIAFLVFAIIAFVALNILLPDKGDDDATDTLTNTTEKDKETGKNPLVPSDNKVIDGKSFTVLLVGNDYQKDDSHSYADSIMLLHFSCETGNAVFLPIPEVTQVVSTGKNVTLAEFYNSHCGSKRDVSKLAKKISDMTGIEIDYYLCTSLRADALAEIVDEIGGIEFNVPQDMNKSDEIEGFTDLKKGKQTLNGEEATSMLRYIEDEEYNERLELSARFFSALIAECEQHILQKNAVSVFESLSLKTNITEDVIMEYLDTVYKYEEFSQLILTYPGDYILDESADDKEKDNKQMVFIANNTKAKEMLSEYVY